MTRMVVMMPRINEWNQSRVLFPIEGHFIFVFLSSANDHPSDQRPVAYQSPPYELAIQQRDAVPVLDSVKGYVGGIEPQGELSLKQNGGRFNEGTGLLGLEACLKV